MIVATKLDEYWKTLTVAEAMKDYSSLRLTCACGRITDYPFVLLLQPWIWYETTTACALDTGCSARILGLLD